MSDALITLNYKDAAGCTKICEQALKCTDIDYIIIVDNMSEDGSFETLQKLQNTRIKVVQSGKNGGYSYGYNFGFRIAKQLLASRVILCNSDILFSPEIVTACFQYLDEHKDVGAVSVRQKNIHGEEMPSAWTYPKYINELKYCFYYYRKFILPKQRRAVYPVQGWEQEVDVLAGCYTVYNMSALDECGMYDENVFLYNEENIISKRLHTAGYKLYRLNGYFYIHAHNRVASKPSTNFKKLLKTAKCSYYFQVNYLHIGLVKQILFKICIFFGTLEQWLINWVSTIRGKKNV